MNKKVLIVLIAISIFITQKVAFAEAFEVNVTIPVNDITVNGELIDTEHSQYPALLYKNITYFPMTWDYLSGIGLELEFDSEEGLKIFKKSGTGKIEQSFLGTTNNIGSTHTAYIADYSIQVNGKQILNNQEEYPILMYKNITYFPMTWRFTVEEFGWKTEWSNEKGLSIVASANTLFKDINLENAIRKSISKLTDSIEEADLFNVKELYIDEEWAAIYSLEGIQNLINLEKLHIMSSNNIKDLTPISELEKLGSLIIRHNNQSIEDLMPVSNLQNLYVLLIEDSQISDISVLSNLGNLKGIGLVNAEIKNLEPLRDLDKIVMLSVDGNDIENIEPLSNLINLETLYINNNSNISSIDSMHNLINLKKIYLSDTNVNDITQLLNLPNIEYIKARNTPISSIDVASAYLECVDRGIELINNHLEAQLKADTSNVSGSESVSVSKELTYSEIEAMLKRKFGTLKSNIGEISFTFSCLVNRNTFRDYDYRVEVGYSTLYFSGVKYSLDYTNEQKDLLIEELKEHQRKIAEYLIELQPSKKFYGGYFRGWYKYPSLRVDWNTETYFSWKNYDDSGSGDYYEAKISEFQWVPRFDNTLERD